MLILTFQRKELLGKIYSGSYSANIWKSAYAHSSIRFTKGYNKILKSISNKTELGLLPEDSCMWGWVSNPYTKLFFPKDSFVAIFMEIPESKLVYSDYDKFTDYIHGDSSNDDFILDDLTSVSEEGCIQCSFMSIKPENICLVTEIDTLPSLEGNVGEIYLKTLARIAWLDICNGLSVYSNEFYKEDCYRKLSI